jgi:hypothetical protein
VAAYIAPPVVLAIITDRVISVIRRHVLPEAEQESAWSPVGRFLLAAVKALALLLLYVLRTCLAPRESVKGLRRMVLDAAPVPGMIVAEVIPLPPGDQVSELAEGEQDAPELPPFPTKKAAFLSLYRGHAAYGVRDQAAAAAAELAPKADLQPGTGRTYILEELRRLEALGGAR